MHDINIYHRWQELLSRSDDDFDVSLKGSSTVTGDASGNGCSIYIYIYIYMYIYFFFEGVLQHVQVDPVETSAVDPVERTPQWCFSISLTW